MPASPIQEMLDMEGGVPQETPSTCPTFETIKELNFGIDTVPKELASSSEQGTAQAEVLP